MAHEALRSILDEVEQSRKASHPLSSLVSANDDLGMRRAAALEASVCFAIEKFPSFAESKKRTIATDTQPRNIAAAFGELRALRDLGQVWPSNIATPSSGADFLITVGDRQLKVEVTTPSGALHDTKTLIEESVDESHSITASTVTPFGRPKKPGDTVQGNAISRLAALKQSEHQAGEGVPCILWIDLNNSDAFPLPISNEQAQPLFGGQQELASGILWWMNYGRKGDPIFDYFELATLTKHFYTLEFDGRFVRGSKFVATVSAVDAAHLLHQNHSANATLDPAWTTELAQLSGAKFEDWWVDWPCAGSLVSRVALAQQSASCLTRNFAPG